MSRPVTEFDLRAEEFKRPDAKPEDYEFRGDGKIVRKDRWENTCRSIASAVHMSMTGSFELPHLVDRVGQLAALEAQPSEEHDLYDRDDGLAHCKVCGGAEGSLPTHCPGRRMSAAEQEAVYLLGWDFKSGVWIEPEPKPKARTYSQDELNQALTEHAKTIAQRMPGECTLAVQQAMTNLTSALVETGLFDQTIPPMELAITAAANYVRTLHQQVAAAANDIRALRDGVEAANKKGEENLDYYMKKWADNIGPPFCNKRHFVDALVMTTRERREEAEKLRVLQGLTDQSIDQICQPGRKDRWKDDGRQYDRDTVRLVIAAIAPKEKT